MLPPTLAGAWLLEVCWRGIPQTWAGHRVLEPVAREWQSTQWGSLLGRHLGESALWEELVREKDNCNRQDGDAGAGREGRVPAERGRWRLDTAGQERGRPRPQT